MSDAAARAEHPVVTPRAFARATTASIAGLIVWAAHFAFVYGWTAVMCARPQASRIEVLGLSLVRFGIVAATVVALAVALVIGVRAVRSLRASGARDTEVAPGSLDRFFDALTAMSAAFGALGILWTGAAVLVGDCGTAEAAAMLAHLPLRPGSC